MDFLAIHKGKHTELEETQDEHPKEELEASDDRNSSCNPSEKDASTRLPPWMNPRSHPVGDVFDERIPGSGEPHRESSQTLKELRGRTSMHLEEAAENNAADVRSTRQAAYLDLSLLQRREHSMGLFCQFQTGESSSRSPFPTPRGSSLSPSTIANALFRSATPGRRSPTTQLTMFYAGNVHVYDVPAETAKTIMLLAASGANLAANFNGSTSFAPTTPISSTPRRSGVQSRPVSSVPQIQTFEAELPIHRKQSLQRFLEKRHDRLSSRAPYRAPVAPQ